MSRPKTPQVMLIGLALIEPDVVFMLARRAGVNAEWFCATWDRQAWSCISELVRSGKSINIGTMLNVAARLGANQIDEGTLCAAMDAAPRDSGCVSDLIESIRDDYIRRRASEIVDEMLVDFTSRSASPSDAAAEAARKLLELCTRPADAELGDVINEIERRWDEAANGNLSGVPMPWQHLYFHSGSVEPKQVCTVVAHGNTGKSSFVLQWAWHASLNGWPCIFFPLEDGVENTYRRLAGMLANTNILKLRLGRADEDTIRAAKEALRRAASNNKLVVSPVRGGISDIAIATQQAVAKVGVRAVFVDALKDIIPAGYGGQYESDNAVISGLTDMAHRLRVPIIVTHHVRKAPTSVKGNSWQAWNITRDDLRGSSRIWDDSRMVIAIQKYPKDKEETVFTYQWHIMKSNHGISGLRRDMRFLPSLIWEEVKDIERIGERLGA